METCKFQTIGNGRSRTVTTVIVLVSEHAK